MGRRWPPPPDSAGMARILDEGAGRLLLLGIGGTLLGVVLTWGFWVGRGFTASPFFLVLIGGVGALLAGIAAATRQARGGRQWNAMRRDYRSILDGLAACEPTYRGRRQWLHEQGVTHRLLGKHLLDVVAQATDDSRGRTGPEPESVVPTIAKGRDTSFPPIRDLSEVEHQLVEADLARFEERHGVTLPAPYQRFLLRFNGGVLKPDWFAYGPEEDRREAHVRHFHPLGSTRPTDLEAWCEAERERRGGRPLERLPIAVTDEDEQICLSVRKDENGGVYLQEGGTVTPTFVADDFFAFLASITWAPGTKPPPAPRRRPRR